MTPRVALFVLLALVAGPLAGCRRVLVPSEPAPPPTRAPAPTRAPVTTPDTSAASAPRANTPEAPRFAAPPVPREMRAVWVATVENMDWPSRPGLSTEQQQRELIAILDKCVELRLNAVVLQVRPAADALYDSQIEPWSNFLTGEMGRAPVPYYDPLEFAITEAHKRGLELHAWINPYRAKVPATKYVSSNHISQTNPELVRKYGPYLWLDPGDPAVRNLTTRVALDIVRRYDIDGLHMDDYFYPYPEVERHRELPFPDESTWQRYRRNGGTLSRDDWRRENVNLLIEQLADGIHAVKPWVKFGISPFGIWRPGYPSSVRGLDQYSTLFADARKWLREGWVDYLTPQLYWAVDRPQQRYDELLRWWVDENVKGRHIWPGNYTGKVAFTNSAAWRTDEVIEQIRLTRAQAGATGNVHFSMSVFQQDPDALDERLRREVYQTPALVPATPWLGNANLAAPALVTRTDSVTGALMLDVYPSVRPSGSDTSVRPATSATQSGKLSDATPWLWVVQRLDRSGWTTQIIPASQRSQTLAARGASAPLEVSVIAVDRLGNASPASVIVPTP